eukprot:748191-Hanusia_phi.AAC.3
MGMTGVVGYLVPYPSSVNLLTYTGEGQCIGANGAGFIAGWRDDVGILGGQQGGDETQNNDLKKAAIPGLEPSAAASRFVLYASRRGAGLLDVLWKTGPPGCGGHFT